MGESPMDEILPFLYVGAESAARDPALLNKGGISHILNVSDRPLPEGVSESQHSVLQVPLSDFGETSLEAAFDECYEFINEARDSNGKVLVHCQFGVNRSPSVVIAYLMKHVPCDLITSFRTVKKHRPSVFPVEGYIRQLMAYELHLYHRSSCSFEDLLALIRSGQSNMFTSAYFRNFKQHGFGNESEDNSEDDQSDISERIIPLSRLSSAHLSANHIFGHTSRSPLRSSFQLNCNLIPVLGEDINHSAHRSSVPISPMQRYPHSPVTSPPHQNSPYRTTDNHSLHPPSVHSSRSPPVSGRYGHLFNGSPPSTQNNSFNSFQKPSPLRATHSLQSIPTLTPVFSPTESPRQPPQNLNQSSSGASSRRSFSGAQGPLSPNIMGRKFSLQIPFYPTPSSVSTNNSPLRSASQINIPTKTASQGSPSPLGPTGDPWMVTEPVQAKYSTGVALEKLEPVPGESKWWPVFQLPWALQSQPVAQ